MFQLAVRNTVFFIYFWKQTLNAWINFHLFVFIAKDIACCNVSDFKRSIDKKSKKFCCREEYVSVFLEMKSNGTKILL